MRRLRWSDLGTADREAALRRPAQTTGEEIARAVAAVMPGP